MMDGDALNAAVIAHRFFDAIEAGDHSAMERIYTADAVVWHNFDQLEIPFRIIVQNLARVRAVLSGFAYKNRRYITVEDGAVLQHSVTGKLPDGQMFEVPMMVRVYFRDGRIYRFEEYVDRTSTAALAAAIAQTP